MTEHLPCTRLIFSKIQGENKETKQNERDLNLQKDSFVGEKEEAGYSAIYYVHLRVIRFGVKHVRLKTAGVFLGM